MWGAGLVKPTCDIEVSGQQGHARLERPHVQVMHADHARNLCAEPIAAA